jgi:hypothetical protein
VGNGRGTNDTSIIAKQPRGTIKGYFHHTESMTDINDFLGGLTSNHQIQSRGGRFYSLLLLAIGNSRYLVDKINNARLGSTSDNVMVDIGILEGSSKHKLSSGYGLVRTKFLSDIT